MEKRVKLLLVSILFVAVFLILVVGVSAGTACTEAACYNPPLVRCPPNDGSFCINYNLVCNCYAGQGGGCIAEEQSISFEKYCENSTHWYALGCSDINHPGGYWGPVKCPSSRPICILGGCHEEPQQCTINSASITPLCDGDCEEGDEIEISISYSSACPNPSYIQVDVASYPNWECIIAHDYGNIQGMNITCTSTSCTGTWEIPELPSECQGKEMFVYAFGLYSGWPPNQGFYEAGLDNYNYPGFGVFNLAGEVGPSECDYYTTGWKTMKRYNGAHLSCNPDNPPVGDVCVIDLNHSNNLYDHYCQNNLIKPIEVIIEL